jgi:Mn2+/Fe2+ NRAMP family transporter
MWQNLMIIALVFAWVQWILFTLNKLIKGHFNKSVFFQAIAWSVWAIYCLYRFIEHYA